MYLLLWLVLISKIKKTNIWLYIICKLPLNILSFFLLFFFSLDYSKTKVDFLWFFFFFYDLWPPIFHENFQMYLKDPEASIFICKCYFSKDEFTRYPDAIFYNEGSKQFFVSIVNNPFALIKIFMSLNSM